MEMDPHSSSLEHLLTEVKSRKVRQRVTLYLTGAATLLGVVDVLAGEYNLPRALFSSVLVYLVFGLPCAVVTAWIHGVQGSQRTGWKEAGVYVTSLLIATVIVFRISGTASLFTPLPAEKSVAVLPFVNMSDNKDDEYFSDGITEDILTQLSKIADLRVISRTSVMQYKNTTKTLQEIGEHLRAAYVLEGSVRRSGRRVRIVGQLIEAQSDRHIWAETYDRDAQDIFSIQSEVATSIAHALRAVLTPAEEERIARRNTESLDAYGLYLRGRECYYRYTREDNDRAIEYFRKALLIDSGYALAYAGIGDAYGMRATRYRMGVQWADSAVEQSSRAIALDPGGAEGYKALGLALDAQGKLREALAQYYRAVELNPNYAPVLGNIGSAEFTLGRYDEALRWVRKAATLQPESGHYHTLVGLQYFSLGFDSAASIWFNRAIALQPEMSFPRILLTYSEAYQGDFNAARERIRQVLLAHPDEYGALEAAGDVELLAGDFSAAAGYYRKAGEQSGIASPPGLKLSFVLATSGHSAEAAKIIRTIVATFDRPAISSSEGSQIPYLLAEAYALKGDGEKGVRWLRAAIEQGFRDYRWMEADPLLGPLRGKPDAEEVISAVREGYEGMRQRVAEEDERR